MIAVIVAYAEGRVIGKDGRIPWDLPEEKKRFRDITMGGTLIMGRRTYEDIGRPLPGRRTIVISGKRAPGKDGAVTVRSPKEALDVAGSGDIFICGGERVFRDFLPLADRLYITEIDLKVDGDAFFPGFDASLYDLVSEERYSGPPDYICRTYERKKHA